MARVIEIEQKDLESNVANLKANSQIPFTGEHDRMHDYLMMYAGESDMYIEGMHKFVVARNEQNQTVGIGLASFKDDEENPKAHLDVLVSTEKGAGTAVMEAIIDYSRQMLNRADLKLTTKDTLKPYYARFNFAQNRNISEGMVRRKSGEFSADRNISKFEPLEETVAQVNAKRRKASMRR